MTTDKQSVYDYSGEQLDVTWDARLCIHVQECTRAHGELFKSGRNPWSEPDRTDSDEVSEVVERCPTGAITYRRKDGKTEQPPAINTITVSNNGPLYVRGDLQIQDAPDDMPGIKTRVALCRCGQSKNKPFCDNSHEGEGFKDHGAIGNRSEDCSTETLPLQINFAKDGPILTNGPLTLITGHGLATWKGEKAALCRCGASKNKPFCDGSHKTSGFSSEN